MLGPYNFDVNPDDFVRLRLHKATLQKSFIVFVDLNSFDFYLESLEEYYCPVATRNKLKLSLPKGDSPRQWASFDLTCHRESDYDFGLYLNDVELEKDERVRQWTDVITTTISEKLGMRDYRILYEGVSLYARQESQRGWFSKLPKFRLPTIWSSAKPNTLSPSTTQTLAADPKPTATQNTAIELAPPDEKSVSTLRHRTRTPIPG